MRLFLRTLYLNITKKLWIFTLKKKENNADIHQTMPELIVIPFDTVQRFPPSFPVIPMTSCLPFPEINIWQDVD